MFNLETDQLFKGIQTIKNPHNWLWGFSDFVLRTTKNPTLCYAPPKITIFLVDDDPFLLFQFLRLSLIIRIIRLIVSVKFFIQRGLNPLFLHENEAVVQLAEHKLRHQITSDVRIVIITDTWLSICFEELLQHLMGTVTFLQVYICFAYIYVHMTECGLQSIISYNT